MTERMPPAAYPWWVKLCMIGARSRRAMVAYMWLSAAAAVLLVGLAVINAGTLRASTATILWVGAAALALAVPWYWLAIRWIDSHGSWDR